MNLNFKEKINQIDSTSIIKPINNKEREELQKELYKIFLDINHVCKENNIELFVVGGSALGAIRHEGFIPWDDDLDVAIKREDYKKFTSLFEKELGNKYILNSPNYSETVINRFPKILKKGTILKDIYDLDENLSKIYLDIFIIDNIPNNNVHRFLKGLYCNVLMFIAGQVFLYKTRNKYVDEIYSKAGNYLYKFKIFVGFIFSFVPFSKWNSLVDNAVQYNKKSSLLGLPTGRKHYFGEIFDESSIYPAKVAKFNDSEVLIFNNIDLYLRNLYGNYMKIPPENKREKHFIRELKL